jgi:hypothetical protein
MPIKAYYDAPVPSFLRDDTERILGVLATNHHHTLEKQQQWAWLQQISILRTALASRPEGRIFLEFYIPRMGKRADAILIKGNIVFVIEFKIGAAEHTSTAFDQVEDYALDLKNFHEGSHAVPIVPVLVSTNAGSQPIPEITFADDLVASPIGTNETDLGALIDAISARPFPSLNVDEWMAQSYKPTPTIVQAAEILYRTHSVIEISRSDSGAKNLHETSATVSAVIDRARQNRTKAICFVTGVPGSGKTLAGLNIATHRSVEHLDEHAVFLSGMARWLTSFERPLHVIRPCVKASRRRPLSGRCAVLSRISITSGMNMSAITPFLLRKLLYLTKLSARGRANRRQVSCSANEGNTTSICPSQNSSLA